MEVVATRGSDECLTRPWRQPVSSEVHVVEVWYASWMTQVVMTAPRMVLFAPGHRALSRPGRHLVVVVVVVDRLPEQRLVPARRADARVG